ncbi:MAG: hypothetical protein ABL866_06130 [Devosia sp.]
MTSGMILEFAPFGLKSGVTEKQLLEASEHLQTQFLERRDGYVSRQLVREKDGRYADLIWWTSAGAVEAAMKAVYESPACATYFALMQMDEADPSAGMKHFTAVAQYRAEI